MSLRDLEIVGALNEPSSRSGKGWVRVDLRRQPGAAIAAGMLAAVSAAGCGATPEKPGLSRAQFIASANAVCGHEQAKLAFIRARAQRFGRPATAPSVIRQQVAQSQLATARLEALSEPPADTGAIKRWLTARTVAATVALDLAEAPARGAPVARSDVQGALASARGRARDLALAYGSRVCGEID
jgi:hypothetical protein